MLLVACGAAVSSEVGGWVFAGYRDAVSRGTDFGQAMETYGFLAFGARAGTIAMFSLLAGAAAYAIDPRRWFLHGAALLASLGLVTSFQLYSLYQSMQSSSIQFRFSFVEEAVPFLAALGAFYLAGSFLGRRAA